MGLFTRLSQRGAMFGMDARIALIVAAILTAAGGITIMSRLERSKVEQAEQGAQTLREGILKYYQTIGINQLPDSIDTLMKSGVMNDPGVKKDPWGNPWYYERFSSAVSLEGNPVTVHYAVVYSAGKDGVANSPSLMSDNDYAQWEPLNDDVGSKVSTRDIEMARLEDYRARAQLIIDKLQTAENSAYIEAQGTCSGTKPPEWCTNTDNKNFTQFNFYPPSSADKSNEVVYYATRVLNRAAYNSGDENDMKQLITDLGLPETYAHDPWGRLLQYHSNVTGRADPPFSASICFSYGENCFTK
ncbi:MAG TPA: hypothetical protein VHP58_04785 [Alphaproteobacteria bacterium]|nr:hypothetical protein [Alphaproteobacteria bacterium]